MSIGIQSIEDFNTSGTYVVLNDGKFEEVVKSKDGKKGLDDYLTGPNRGHYQVLKITAETSKKGASVGSRSTFIATDIKNATTQFLIEDAKMIESILTRVCSGKPNATAKFVISEAFKGRVAAILGKHHRIADDPHGRGSVILNADGKPQHRAYSFGKVSTLACVINSKDVEVFPGNDLSEGKDHELILCHGFCEVYDLRIDQLTGRTTHPVVKPGDGPGDGKDQKTR